MSAVSLAALHARRPITDYTRLVPGEEESYLETSIVSLQAPAPAWRCGAVLFVAESVFFH